MTDPSPFLTASELAQRWKISRASVYRLFGQHAVVLGTMRRWCLNWVQTMETTATKQNQAEDIARARRISRRTALPSVPNRLGNLEA